ncbi:hypothetical protein [Paraburkholderia bryophila]|jgi:hypothetical protein|uniref:Uncharacterized protein n=1 Tax=Paraburkholderia bryophila TaxID=420952 RepID=A0A329CW92_9BURK|nr:hypothetical protein [Paraburkholderia bryophila]RAS38182.1 hypothetical protein BX591_102472 [Paraburkholderia bryophila]
MNASIRTPYAQRPPQTPAAALSARLPLVPSFSVALIGTVVLLAACFSVAAHAQQTVNPGDIIVERTVTPRDAFIPVPKSQDPVAVRATTFPANSFNPAIAQLVGDTDLTNAHGSSGVADGGVLGGTGMQAVTQILSGKTTGNNVALNAGGIGLPGPGIGGTITSSVTGALAPLSNALSGSLGGLK